MALAKTKGESHICGVPWNNEMLTGRALGSVRIRARVIIVSRPAADLGVSCPPPFRRPPRAETVEIRFTVVRSRKARCPGSEGGLTIADDVGARKGGYAPPSQD